MCIEFYCAMHEVLPLLEGIAVMCDMQVIVIAIAIGKS
jgi:hypothetical protein